ATPSYFAATGSRLWRGRFFTDADRNGPPVVVVNEATARTYWPQRDAIGECVRLFSRTAPCSTVIGIVRDSPVEGVVEKPVLPLIVAALGTFSVLSYAVTQRQHEIGVRIALGARGSDVRRLVVGQGVGLATAGVAVGVSIALAASRVMQSLLYDTSPRDPVV